MKTLQEYTVLGFISLTTAPLLILREICFGCNCQKLGNTIQNVIMIVLNKIFIEETNE